MVYSRYPTSFAYCVHPPPIKSTLVVREVTVGTDCNVVKVCLMEANKQTHPFWRSDIHQTWQKLSSSTIVLGSFSQSKSLKSMWFSATFLNLNISFILMYLYKPWKYMQISQVYQKKGKQPIFSIQKTCASSFLIHPRHLHRPCLKKRCFNK